MIVIDTNIVSELMRAKPDPRVQNWLVKLGQAPIATTTITLAEIVYGLCRLPHGRRRNDLETKFEAFVGPESGLLILTFDDVAAREAGRVRAAREAMGGTAAPSDMMIAGIVCAVGADLATRNTRDFDGLSLRLIDPWAE